MDGTAQVPAGGRLVPLLLLLGLLVSFHLPAVRSPFVGDDFTLLDKVGFRTLPQALVLPDPLGDAFRPVGRQLPFWLLTHWGHASPVAAHASNLLLLLIALALFAGLAWSVAGGYAATLALALLGLSYAVEVPLLWVSAGQYLIALVWALAACVLHRMGARVLAGIAMFLALLSNEAMVFAPLVAILVARRPREFVSDSLRNAVPLFAAVGAWFALWLAVLPEHRLPGSVALRMGSVPAAFVHLFQIFVGAEWKPGAGMRPHIAVSSLVVVALAVPILFWASMRRRQARSATSSQAERSGSRASRIGLLWLVAGTLPLIPAAPTWSAHEYLFPLCGIALLVGAWAARQPRWLGPTLVTLVGLLSQNTRGLDSVAAASDPWTTQSHVSRAALEQEMKPASRFVADLKHLHRRLPPKCTLFFGNVPHFWDAGGGHLVRWAYGDSTLRTFDFAMFSLDRASRGPALFFAAEGDTLRELAPADLRDFGVAALRNRYSDPAHEMLEYAVSAAPDDWVARYWLAWVEWSRGDTTTAISQLTRLGMRSTQPFEWEGSWTQKVLAAGDSLQAIEMLTRVMHRQPLDPEIHHRLAALVRGHRQYEQLADVEAYAARVLARRPRSQAPIPPRSEVSANEARP